MKRKRKKRAHAAERLTAEELKREAEIMADVAKTGGRYVMVMVASFGVDLPTLNQIGAYLRAIPLNVPVPEEEKFTLSVEIEGHKAPIEV